MLKEKINNIIFVLLEIVFSGIFLFFSINNQLFNAMQCLLFVLCLPIPFLLQIIFKIKIDHLLFLIYYTFLIAHFLCGEILSFYITLKYYDVLLHLSSAFCLCIFGYSIIHYYLDEKHFNIQLLFAIFFALSSEFIWEIIEYSIDDLFNTNMQRFMQNGIKLCGHLALKDTIKDMIVTIFGCLIFILIINKSKLKNIKSKKSSDKD